MSHKIVDSLLPGDLVFDIGAHLGDKSEWFARSDLKVVCIEPQPEMASTLRERFCKNENITIRQVGVGNRRGIMEMQISSDSPVLSTFAPHWTTGRFLSHTWDKTAEIEIVLFDDLIEEFGTPRYSKIDVEGYEREVISGLSKKAGIISFEFTNEFMDHAFEVIRKLIQIGYTKFNLSLAENTDFYFPDWKNYVDIVSVLQSSRSHQGLWGDVYAN
jgi:FkbM family methyltransferase